MTNIATAKLGPGGFKVHGCWAWYLGPPVQGTGYRVQGTGYRVQGATCDRWRRVGVLRAQAQAWAACGAAYTPNGGSKLFPDFK